MTEELISFETAKLAKEKGFKHNSKCYGGNGEILENIENHTNNIMQRFRYEAPTQSLLQKWLREKHEIIVVIDNWYNQPVDGKIYKFCFQPVINCENQINTLCKTYEEALERGLQEALKLI